MISAQDVVRRMTDRTAGRTDSELVTACLEGQPRAWDQLVDRFGRLVYAVARRCGLGDADAEDVFQQVFVTLHRRLGDLRDGERLSAWLITSTRREAWRTAARRRRTEESAADWAAIDDGSSADAEADLLERQHLVRTSLKQLGGRCEKLLTALFNAPGEPNYEAIARDLGMKVGSIGPTRARCFRKLEKILVELGFDPETLVAATHEND